MQPIIKLKRAYPANSWGLTELLTKLTKILRYRVNLSSEEDKLRGRLAIALTAEITKRVSSVLS